jgi:hypothetical protein
VVPRTGSLLLACLPLLAGCSRQAAETGDADDPVGPARPSASGPSSGLSIQGVSSPRPELWQGTWESEEFPGLSLQIDGVAVVGVYAGGQGHWTGELWGSSVDFEFWSGAEDFYDAPLELRGSGGGTMDADGLVKGRYWTDTAEERRWSMVRPTAAETGD